MREKNEALVLIQKVKLLRLQVMMEQYCTISKTLITGDNYEKTFTLRVKMKYVPY